MFKLTVPILVLALVLYIGTAESAIKHMPMPPIDSGVLENPNRRADATEVLNYRLPNSTYPEHYAIELTTAVHTGERQFTGVVVIDIVVAEATIQIVVHARQTKNFEAIITHPTTGATETLTTSYEDQREFLTLTRPSGIPFEVNSKWKVTIKYSGELRTDRGGFYMTSYTDSEGKER